MPSSIFVNIPVRDLKASMAYYKALGFDHNPQFTDETASCIVIDESIYFMVLTHEKFLSFSPNPIPDPKTQTQALYGLSRDSREAVDAIAEAGIKAGGREVREPQDYGFMYSRAVADVDGHVWEFIWMDMSQMPTE
jgi:predicted lactoylglutathione lyase